MKLFITSIILSLLYTFLKTTKSFQMLQQNWYNEDNRYLKWLYKNRYLTFINKDMFFIGFIVFIFLKSHIASLLFVIFYIVVIGMFITKKEQVKIPLVFTKRIRRLSITTLLLYLLPLIVIIPTYNDNNITYYYLISGLLIYLNSLIVVVANYINKPIERFVYRYYYRKASKKIKSMNLDVIGITGSYGKTSSKNILFDILNVKYNVFKTPKNYNTTYGLMLSINNHLDKFNDLFIAEMGAFKEGEIKELCDFVKPKYGILTTIGQAHLESFGSQENIQKTKFELIESLPQDGIAILNKDDELQVSYKMKNKCRVVWIGIDNEADVRAENIKVSSLGTSFKLVINNNKKKYDISTCLLGKNNVYNVLASIALALELGMNIEQIIMGTNQIKPITHRLELKKNGNITIIDDAYNSNPVGSKTAVEVLGLMPGKRIIVTPGMIELGKEEYELNFKFGTYMVGNVDEVILIGEKQTKPIYEGLISKKFNQKNIHILNDVKEAFVLINKLQKKDTFVLLENDLPDTFNE